MLSTPFEGGLGVSPLPPCKEKQDLWEHICWLATIIMLGFRPNTFSRLWSKKIKTQHNLVTSDVHGRCMRAKSPCPMKALQSQVAPQYYQYPWWKNPILKYWTETWAYTCKSNENAHNTDVVCCPAVILSSVYDNHIVKFWIANVSALYMRISAFWGHLYFELMFQYLYITFHS